MKKLLLLLLLIPSLAFAAPLPKTITASCTAPTTREDGSALLASEIGSYHFTLTKNAIVIAEDAAVAECFWVVTALTPGTYELTASVFDTEGLKSDDAALQTKINARPSKIVIITVIVEITE